MINHYFFLRQLGFQLDLALKDATIDAVYSTSLQELHLVFGNSDAKMLLRVNWETEFSLLHWSIHQALNHPKNYEKQLFDAWGKTVVRVHAVRLERLICIELENGASIWLKLFGKMGNAIFMTAGIVSSVFRRSRQKDFDFDVTTFSFDQKTESWSDLRACHETGSSQVLKNLKWPAFETMSPTGQDQWFCNPRFDLRDDDTPMLRGTLAESLDHVDYLALASAFWRAYLPKWVLINTKSRLLKELNTILEKLQQRMAEAKERIVGLYENISYEQMGHLIMSHAHTIQPKTAQVVLPSFENPEQLISIKMNPNLSPYDNASRFYQKSKNQHIEINKLNNYIDDLTVEHEGILIQKIALDEVNNLRSLNKLLKKTAQTDISIKPWRILFIADFEVWIGKNASGNDELLRNVHKDDLWLHARKVTGSHVVIRSAGKTIPKNVLQQAASWAAWFSKGKNESLCPVIHTARKHVRKRKGSPAGSVLVEKEEVILVPPLKPNLPND